MDEKKKITREDFPLKCSDSVNAAFKLDAKYQVSMKAMMKALMQASMEEVVNPWDVVNATYDGFRELSAELQEEGLSISQNHSTGCLSITKMK